ncbi:MAG: MT-A70 family methyltransferase, partial [Bacteroidota bacterium]
PWNKRKGGVRKVRSFQGRNLDYQTMETDTIFKLLDDQIFTLANEQHLVFMWTIDQFLLDCEYQMEKRGYKRHARLIWNKLNGVAPAFSIRYAHEYLIWYYKPKFLKIANDFRGKYLTVFEEKAREHSRKPDIAYDIINNFYPNYRKIDVFSREKRIGYDQFGDQIDLFNRA